MTTLQHSTEANSMDKSTLYQPGSPANLTPLQENVRRLVTSVISGERWCEYWGNRNQLGFWEKTSQDSLALNLDISSDVSAMTWPYWGTAWDGAAGKLVTLGLATKGEGSLSLPTLRCSEGMQHNLRSPENIGDTKSRVEDVIAMLPTPRTSQDFKPIRPLAPSEADGSHGITLCGAIGDALEMSEVPTGDRGTLNPSFVTAMMMFPDGWLDVS
jgi:hypothetical protein